MRYEMVRAAQLEAERFSDKCEELLNDEQSKDGGPILWGSAKTGSVRRSSLDLTRILAEMRKPN